jgi:hypothetical protein
MNLTLAIVGVVPFASGGPFMDEPSRSPFRPFIVSALVLVGSVLLLPVTLLLALGYYVLALGQGVGSLVRFLTGQKPPPPTEPLPGPHLWIQNEQAEARTEKRPGHPPTSDGNP